MMLRQVVKQSHKFAIFPYGTEGCLNTHKVRA